MDADNDKFTADEIARAVTLGIFNRQCLSMTNCTKWTGYEADILCVHKCLQLIR